MPIECPAALDFFRTRTNMCSNEHISSFPISNRSSPRRILDGTAKRERADEFNRPAGRR
jgi:hypothetical protein